MKSNVVPTGTDALAALARKYRLLAALRRDRERGLPIPEREVFRALAEEFPGALRELDTLALTTIDRRADELEAALAGTSAVAIWMHVVHEHHAWLRAALLTRRHVRRHDELAETEAERIVALVSARLALPVDVAFVRGVHRPPDGRMGTLVVAGIASRHALTIDEVRAILFPRENVTPSPR